MNLKQINKIIKSIKEKEELELNLSQFGNAVATKYTEFAMLNLSMSFYMDCDTLLTNPRNSELKGIVKTVSSIVENCIVKGNVSIYEKSIEKLDKIRKEIGERVKLLTVYTDDLSIYGNIINKKIMKFQGEELNFTDEVYAAHIMKYIFSEKDNGIVNFKIKNVLSKLPVRMCRIKFFDLVGNALSVYKGNSLYNLNCFVEIIESYAMIARPLGYGKDFPKTYNKILKLQESVVGQTDHKKFNKTKVAFDKTMAETEEISDMYVQAIKIVNDLYAVLLVLPYVIEESKTIDTCTTIITTINKGLQNGEIEEKQIDAMFETIEGEQEVLSDEISILSDRLLSVVEQNNVDIENSLLGAKYNSLIKAQEFYTNSLFVYVNQIKDTGELVDEPKLKVIQEAIITKLSESFKDRNSELNWAVMAVVLSELPVIFNNSEEITSYVNNALQACGDIQEKLASISLILNE